MRWSSRLIARRAHGLFTYLAFLLACLAISALLAIIAAWRVRAVAVKQAGRGVASPRRRFGRRFSRPAWLPRLPGPSLDGNPVLWREWQRFRPSRLLRVVWFLFTIFGVIELIAALKFSSSTRTHSDLVAGMATFQFAIGLLLLSVSAATSLAEERTRGSLDILLSTPLSTFAIVVGKWWGAFRLAPHVIFWPALLAGILLWDGGSWVAYLLLLGLLLVYCAVTASLGLAVATWVSRLGRAVALCVTVVVGFSIGWMFLVMSCFDRGYTGIALDHGQPSLRHGHGHKQRFPGPEQSPESGLSIRNRGRDSLDRHSRQRRRRSVPGRSRELRPLSGPHAGIKRAGLSKILKEMAAKCRRGPG